MHMHSDALHAPANDMIVRSSERGLTGASNTLGAQVQPVRFQSVYCLHLRFSSVNPPEKNFTAGQLEIESSFSGRLYLEGEAMHRQECYL